MYKKEIRQRLLMKRAAIPCEERAVKDEEIRRRLTDLPEWIQSEVILVYLSFGSEVDTWGIVDHALALNKAVYCPRITDSSRHIMEFLRVFDKNVLRPGAMGILEPESGEIYNGDDAMMIMPGVAFTSKLMRVGYGGGYYDRYLAGDRGLVRRVALCYDCQYITEAVLDADERDIRPEAVVTESAVYRINECRD